jgi:flagellar biosynthesis/type III secretory pathway protein FliH
MSDEPAYKRIERIRVYIENAQALPPGDARFLLTRHDEAQNALRAQQDAVNDAARRWREIGYEDGYSKGYEEALRGIEE